MPLTHIKKPIASATDTPDGVAEAVRGMLDALRREREAEATRLASRFDHWDGPIIVDRAAFDAARANLAPSLIDDIHEAHRHIRTFAAAQRDSLRPFEIEVVPGLRAGHRLVPVSVAGCYVPAGRFAHIASALMSVTTSVAAGVGTTIVTSPARDERGGVHPAILVAADIAGAAIVLGLGGVQGIAALAFGLFTGKPADIVVGPGNSYVAEAKRQLFGEVGIDLVAGPTESMIVADDTADAHRVAVDLVGQAEHGVDSPVWLATTSRRLALAVAELVPEVAARLPEPARSQASTAWASYGEIILADTREEAAAVCDEYAAEHLQVMTADLEWWHQRLTNYGSLFLGSEASVTFGDKSAGPNHILPTRRAARYTGGLNALKFLKQLTYQELTPEAASRQGALAARISRYEGMEGHARSADLRANAPDVSVPPPDDSDASGALRLPKVDLDFTGQEPIPASATQRVQELLRSGNLFRYGETGTGEDDAAALEAEFAAIVGRKYCVAFNSCGAAMAASLIAVGVQRDEPVLMNAFTLAPVPGAITHAGARPALVGITADYRIDVGDLRRAADETGARWLLLSYMRGHIPNLDELVVTCGELGINLIEDCAHTMGARWDGRSTGTFGVAGCFSSQSFKHVNSGEGGLLVTDDDDVAAKAVLLSGSYMLYEQHGARPPAEVFDRHRVETPNLSMRMSALSAALLRPQLELLPGRIRTWNERYSQLAGLLADVPGVRLPVRPSKEGFVGSSIQFDLSHDDRAGVVHAAADRGVPLKWFGAEEPLGFTSRFDHWGYVDDGALDATRSVLDGLFDMRIPLSMTAQQAEDVVAVVRHAIAHPMQP